MNQEQILNHTIQCFRRVAHHTFAVISNIVIYIPVLRPWLQIYNLLKKRTIIHEYEYSKVIALN